LGFLLYGGRLFLMLRRFPIESKGRRKKLHEVGCVTAICFTCFLIRCFVVALSAFDTDANLDVMYHPILNLIYYMLVEILPSALVLFILRKLPPKRMSGQYHPIRWAWSTIEEHKLAEENDLGLKWLPSFIILLCAKYREWMRCVWITLRYEIGGAGSGLYVWDLLWLSTYFMVVVQGLDCMSETCCGYLPILW